MRIPENVPTLRVVQVKCDGLVGKLDAGLEVLLLLFFVKLLALGVGLKHPVDHGEVAQSCLVVVVLLQTAFKALLGLV